jgi:hypothetical protein
MAERPPDHHVGVAPDDPRNRAPIAYFKPKPVTADSARASLRQALPHATDGDVEARVERLLQKIATGPIKSDPPLSQSLAEVDDPWYGLGTHPDIIEHMWKLDDTLPRSCRWVFWGGPALVHPQTGVVFAVGFGTIGYVMRLPPHVLAQAMPEQASQVVRRNPTYKFDISAGGPEWRFVTTRAPEAEWCRAAYDFAGLPATGPADKAR